MTIADPILEIKAELQALKVRVSELEAEMEQFEKAQSIAAIQRGSKEIDAGKFKPAREAFEEFRKKNHIPTR